MSDWLSLPPVKADMAAASPYIAALLAAMVLDILLGLVVAFGAKELSSSVSWRGMTKKAATMIIVALCAVLDPFVLDVPLAKCAAIFYLGTNGISLVENAGRVGVPIPSTLLEALAKLRGQSRRKPSPEVNP